MIEACSSTEQGEEKKGGDGNLSVHENNLVHLQPHYNIK